MFALLNRFIEPSPHEGELNKDNLAMMKPRSEVGECSFENVQLYTQIPHHHLPDEKILEEIKARTGKDIFFSSKVLTDGFFKNKVIIDAGCGCGIKALSLSSKGAKIFGLDGSKTQVARAREYCRALKLDAEFFEGFLEDFNELIVKNNIPAPDLIICTAAIHHLSNYESVIKQFSEVLKPGGYLYLSWADPTLSLGGLIIKNQIAYRLGWNIQSRLLIGKLLFGWWDIRRNHMNVEPRSYFADHYCAYYVPITPSRLLRTASGLGLELCESFPPLYSTGPDSGSRLGIKGRLANMFIRSKYFFRLEHRPRLMLFKKTA